MAFIIDAGLGAGFSELFKVVKVGVRYTISFKSNLETLEYTLESVKPMFYEFGKLNSVLNRPGEEIDQFVKKLNRGVDLVNECSRVSSWNAYKKYFYSRKLEKLDKCIVKFFNVQVQGFVYLSSLSNGRGIKEIHDKIDFILKFFNIKYKYTSAGVYDDSLSGVSNWESVLGLPDVVFGFNKPLQDLKEMLLRDKDPVKVISAPRGFGKTTLAKLLCRDTEIQGIFGKNIFFVTVSNSAKINCIAEEILKFQLPESQLPDFQNDDDAIKHLECFLKQISPSPILLVLDDVWPDMVSLIDSLTFTLPNYKILVTSRFSLPRFSHVYNLENLDDEDAMSLFCHSARLKDGTSNIPPDLVEKVVKVCKGFPLALILVGRSLSGCPEVVWRRNHKIWSDGKSILDTHRVSLDCLPTSLYAPEQMQDSSVKDCYMDLGSCPEAQSIPANTRMDSAKRLPTTINIHIHIHQGDFSPIVKTQGKSKTTNADKGIKADKMKSKTIQRSGPKLQLRRNGAFQIRTGLSGVVIREPSSEVIPPQVSECQATSRKGGKGKEKIVPKPKKKTLISEADHYYLDKDESERLLQQLTVFMPAPGHVRRPPTNGTSSVSNQWNSQTRKGMPGVVIREPSSQVSPSQASQHEATSTKVGKGKEKVVYQPKKKVSKSEGDNYYLI